MGVHLVTGYAGKEHITSADHGVYNAGTYGPGKYVLRTGNMFAAEVISNNLIKIKDGDLINQGRHINIAVNDYEECEIDNGQQSLKRNDLIVVRYTKNNETMIETAQVLVLKGASSATPADPKYVTGDILNGAETDDFPLYRVRLNGLSIEKVEPLFSTIVSVKDILDLIGNKDISKLGDGTITGGLSALNTDLMAFRSYSIIRDDGYALTTLVNILFNRLQSETSPIVFSAYLRSGQAYGCTGFYVPSGYGAMQIISYSTATGVSEWKVTIYQGACYISDTIYTLTPSPTIKS